MCISLTVSEIEHLLLCLWVLYCLFGELPVYVCCPFGFWVIYSLFMDSMCLFRSSVPADQWQAATLGKAAGESAWRL